MPCEVELFTSGELTISTEYWRSELNARLSPSEKKLQNFRDANSGLRGSNRTCIFSATAGAIVYGRFLKTHGKTGRCDREGAGRFNAAVFAGFGCKVQSAPSLSHIPGFLLRLAGLHSWRFANVTQTLSKTGASSPRQPSGPHVSRQANCAGGRQQQFPPILKFADVISGNVASAAIRKRVPLVKPHTVLR